MKTDIKNAIDPGILAFEALLSDLKNQIVKAGQLLVALQHDNPDTFNILLKRNPSLTQSALERIYNAGIAGNADIALCMRAVGAKLEQLAPSEQKIAVAGKIAVVVGGTPERPIVVEKKGQDLSPEEQKQCLDGRHLRSIKHQVAIRTQKEAEKSKKNPSVPNHRASKNGITFNPPFLTWEELAQTILRYAASLAPYAKVEPIAHPDRTSPGQQPQAPV